MNPVKKIWSGFRLLVNHPKDRAVLSWALMHRKRLAQFDNKHLGKACFIIGNGPSLNRMDLARIRDTYSFGLNKIYLHPQFRKINVDYHVAVNPLVIEQSIEEFKRMECTSFLSFRPCFARKLVSEDFQYLMTDGSHRFSSNLYEAISEGCTVTYVALQLAFFMGFREVFLIGVDHSFKSKGTPHEKQLMSGPDENHFHPNYFSGMEWQLPDLEGSEVAYHLANYNFRRSGGVIYDATLDGKLEVFPKLSFDEALARCATGKRAD